MRQIGLALSATLSLLIAHPTVTLAWPHSTTQNLPLGTGPGSQWITVPIGDGAGGAIVALQNEANGPGNIDLYAQHVLQGGALDPRWGGIGGRPLATAPGNQQMVNLCTDGAGGAIFAWVDFSSGRGDIYAQHVRQNGSAHPAWAPDGAPVCTMPYHQYLYSVAPDGAGGELLGWLDERSAFTVGSFQPFLHHVRANGTPDPAWPLNGEALLADSTIYSGDIPELVS